MTPEIRAEGFVLSKRPFRESDQIYTVFTREYGKIDFKAKGSRKISSKLASHLEPFSRSYFHLIQGKRGNILIAVEAQERYMDIRRKSNNLLLATHANYLIDIASKWRQVDDELYDMLCEWFLLLNVHDEYSDAHARWLLGSFAMKLLGYCGYKPEIHQCLQCKKAIKPGAFAWSGLRGGIVCRTCLEDYRQDWMTARIIQDDAIKLMRFAYSEGFESHLNLRLNTGIISEFLELVESLFLAHLPILPSFSLPGFLLAFEGENR